MGEEKRHEMMETIFGEDFAESDDEQEAAERERGRSASASQAGSDYEEGEGEVDGDAEGDGEVGEGEAEGEGEGEGEGEAEGEGDGEGQGDVEAEGGEAESEGERAGSDAEREQSDAERAETDGEREESEGEREEASDGEREAASEGYREAESEAGGEEREVSGSGSEQSSRARRRAKDYEAEDIVADDDIETYEEEPQTDRRGREKPVGEPLDLEVPLRKPPGRLDQMNLVRVSNIMGIEPKPFDPKTYEEQETTFVTDESGRKQRIRLEENVARWRVVRNRHGSLSYESNARFVKWSDGSLQLHLGSEVLDIAVQDSRHDQSHLFLRHPKGILQSQGRLANKMKFMPSSLSSKSHKLLTALVDSRHKKVFKVKNVVTTMDPEKEKVEKERAAEQRIRSKEDLQRKQERVKSKYIPAHRERDAQLSPGYLEVALDEDEEADDFAEGRRAVDARRFQEQLEAEGRAERRMMSAKRQPPASREPLPKSIKNRRPPPPSRRDMADSQSEESDREPSYKSEGEDDGYAGADALLDDEEEWEDKPRHREEKRRSDRDDDRRKRKREKEEEVRSEPSPPKKPVQRRRVVVSDSEDD